jgi:hypothetical protein
VLQFQTALASKFAKKHTETEKVAKKNTQKNIYVGPKNLKNIAHWKKLMFFYN